MQTEWKLTSHYTENAFNLSNEKNNSLLWIKNGLIILLY